MTSQPQLRKKLEMPINPCVSIGNSALEFSNCLTIFGTTNVSNSITMPEHTTNSSTG